MKISVTGGSGTIGAYIVADLLEHGHEVSVLERTAQRQFVASSGKGRAISIGVDVTNVGEVTQALAAFRPDAVIHMAAWANDHMVPASRTFGENIHGTFNIFQACADLGIRRIVWGSSGQVYGFEHLAPVYLPVDEDHPLRPLNPYAMSKVAGERVAEYFAERHGLDILSFRILGVRAPAQLTDEIKHVAQHPEGGRFLLWSRGDARDCALACRLALEASQVTSGAYNISGGLVLNTDPAMLAETYFGGKIEIRSALGSGTPLYSVGKAERAFGYRPRHVWSESTFHPESGTVHDG